MMSKDVIALPDLSLQLMLSDKVRNFQIPKQLPIAQSAVDLLIFWNELLTNAPTKHPFDKKKTQESAETAAELEKITILLGIVSQK